MSGCVRSGRLRLSVQTWMTTVRLTRWQREVHDERKAAPEEKEDGSPPG